MNTKLTPKRIVSLHLPKAGGTSLYVQFAKLLGDQVLHDYTHGPFTADAMETAEFPIGKVLVHGHFRAQRYASVDAYWMTFLRHPVDNLISIYFFLKARPEPANTMHARLLSTRPSILEFARYPGVTKLMSETFFGGFDMNRFNFIGIYENRKADIARLAHEIGLPIKAEVYENRTIQTNERRELEANQALRRQLTDLLSADIAFYEKVLHTHSS